MAIPTMIPTARKRRSKGALVSLLALVSGIDYLFLPPVCLAIAIVTSAAHREDIGEIVRHTVRSWIVLMGGILMFMLSLSYFFEWVLPS